MLAVIVVVRGLTVSSRQIRVPAPTRLAVDGPAAAKRLGGAIRFRTIAYKDESKLDAEAFVGLRDYLRQTFPLAHEHLSHELHAGHSSLFRWPGSDPALEPILLLAHYDVVPVEPATAAQWQHPPFSGAVADGFIWERGTLDFKVGVVALLEAVEGLIGQGYQPRRTVLLAFGHDEEVGGRGAPTIVEGLIERGQRAHFVVDEGSVLVEPGIVPGLKAPAALVGVCEKGYATLRLTASAAGGHSSMPPQGGAVASLARAIGQLEAQPMPATIEGPLAEQFDYLGPEMPFGLRLVFANRWLLSGVLKGGLDGKASTRAQIRTTTAFTMLEGGPKENVLPMRAVATVNLRIKPGDTVAGALRHVQQVVGDEITVELLPGANDPSPVSSTAAPTFALMQQTVAELFPDSIFAPSMVVGMTDARHYARVSDNVYRFVPLRLGREDLERIHGVNERIGIDNYVEIVQFYARLIQNGTGG